MIRACNQGRRGVVCGGWFETAHVQDEPLLIYSQQTTSAEGVTHIVQVAFPIAQTRVPTK